MPTPSADPIMSANTRRSGGVLVVDPDSETRRLLREVLTGAGFSGEEAADVETALSLASEARPAAVVLHEDSPGEPGLETLRLLRAQHPDLPLVLIAHFGELADQDVATHLDAVACVGKPFRVPDLLAGVRRAMAPGAHRWRPRRVRRAAAPIPLPGRVSKREARRRSA